MLRGKHGSDKGLETDEYCLSLPLQAHLLRFSYARSTVSDRVPGEEKEDEEEEKEEEEDLQQT
jgi:hypothetical protein